MTICFSYSIRLIECQLTQQKKRREGRKFKMAKKYRPALLKWHEEERRNQNGHLEYYAGAMTSFGTHFNIFIGDEGFRIVYVYAGDEKEISVGEPMPADIYEKAKEIAKRNCQKIYEQQWLGGSEVLDNKKVVKSCQIV